MKYLRQSTTATLVIGPFVAKADGVTAQTGLSDQSTNGRLTKNGTGSSVTLTSWAHDNAGSYLVGLSTGHTDTIGRLRLAFSDSTIYLPVWEDFTVLSAAVYDVLFGTTAPSTLDAATVRSALGLATNNLDTQLTTITGYVDTVESRLPAALVAGRMDVSVGAYQSGLAPLQPTIPGNTLDVSATGEAGIDWSNVGSPTATVVLANTTLATVTDKAGYSLSVGDHANVAADVQTGLTAQGYTVTRSGKLDYLDVAVSSRSTLTASQVLTTVMTESYATSGTAFTLAQGCYMLWSALSQFSVSGTTVTGKKLDGTTAAMTFTLDDATNPTSRVRAT